MRAARAGSGSPQKRKISGPNRKQVIWSTHHKQRCRQIVSKATLTANSMHCEGERERRSLEHGDDEIAGERIPRRQPAASKAEL